MSLIWKIIAGAISVILAAYILPGVNIDSVITAIVLAAVLAILNNIVKPILIIITIPATILTLGLFLLVINAMIILMADYLVDGFQVSNFWWALLFSFIVSFINSLLNNDKEKKSKKNEL